MFDDVVIPQNNDDVSFQLALIPPTDEPNEAHQPPEAPAEFEGRRVKKKGKYRKADADGAVIKRRMRREDGVKTHRLGLTKKGQVRRRAKPYKPVKGSLWDRVASNYAAPGEVPAESLPTVPSEKSIYLDRKKNLKGHNTQIASDPLARVSAEDEDIDFSIQANSAREEKTSVMDALFQSDITDIFGDADPGDYSAFSNNGGFSQTIVQDQFAERSPFDIMMTQTFVEDHDFSTQLPAYEHAYKWTPKAKYSSSDDR
eukprot:GHVH01001253.1.p2 GENE.GHVH01001253.1~~GHVH01001253.1.p2  ORF type:complete len:296 (-),score=60.36 GHVH01001253.1:2388-3158(-)